VLFYPETVAPPAGTSWCAASPANDNIPPTVGGAGRRHIGLGAGSRAITAPSP
jgi:hypothetical protein